MALLAALLASPRGDAHAAGPLLLLTPASQTVAYEAGTIAVDVEVQDLPPTAAAAAIEFQVDFNPSIVRFDSFTQGPFLSSTGRSVVCPSPDSEVGTVKLGCASNGTQPTPPSGGGLVGTIRFTLRAGGSTDLTVRNAQTGDAFAIGGLILPATGATLTITGGPTPEPTPYSTPVPVPPTPASSALLSTPEDGVGQAASGATREATAAGGAAGTGSTASGGGGSGETSGAATGGSSSQRAGRAPIAGTGPEPPTGFDYGALSVWAFVAGLVVLACGYITRDRDVRRRDNG